MDSSRPDNPVRIASRLNKSASVCKWPRKVGKIILIIEDEIPVRSTLCLVFEASGYRVLNAKTAKEGVHLFGNNPVDLVLLDFHLPDDGTWLGPEMKRRKPLVPIIVLSGAPEAIGAKAYADTLLAKPMGPPDLLKKVSDLLGRAGRARINSADRCCIRCLVDH